MASIYESSVRLTGGRAKISNLDGSLPAWAKKSGKWMVGPKKVGNTGRKYLRHKDTPKKAKKAKSPKKTKSPAKKTKSPAKKTKSKAKSKAKKTKSTPKKKKSPKKSPKKASIPCNKKKDKKHPKSYLPAKYRKSPLKGKYGCRKTKSGRVVAKKSSPKGKYPTATTLAGQRRQVWEGRAKMTRGGLTAKDLCEKKVKGKKKGSKTKIVPLSRSRPTKKKSKENMKASKERLKAWRDAVKAVNDGKIPVPFPKKGSPLHTKAMEKYDELRGKTPAKKKGSKKTKSKSPKKKLTHKQREAACKKKGMGYNKKTKRCKGKL